MHFTLHATRTPHGASRLGRAISAWSGKTRRAPSRHCRDARVYGRTTTAMHAIEYTPSPPYIGWVSVGWQRHCKTCRKLRNLGNQGTFFFFLFGGRPQLVVELDPLCER